MARAPGTYYTLDKGFLDSLLRRVPAKEGVLLYLQTKENFDFKGASKGELLDALSCATKTLDNALSALQRSGEVREQDCRYFPTLSPDVSPTSGKKSGNAPATNPVQDGLFSPLEGKEGKEDISLSRDASLFEKPSWLDEGAWGAWESYNLERGVELTATQREAQLAKLGALTRAGEPQAQIIARSIESGWNTFYPDNYGAASREFSRRRTDAPATAGLARNARGGAAHGSGDARRESYVPVPGEGETREVRSRRQAEVEREEAELPVTDYAAMPVDEFEALVRRNRGVVGEQLRRIRASQLADLAARAAEAEAVAARGRLQRQAEALSGGPDPPGKIWREGDEVITA